MSQISRERIHNTYSQDSSERRHLIPNLLQANQSDPVKNPTLFRSKSEELSTETNKMGNGNASENEKSLRETQKLGDTITRGECNVLASGQNSKIEVIEEDADCGKLTLGMEDGQLLNESDRGRTMQMLWDLIAEDISQLQHQAFDSECSREGHARDEMA